MNDNPRKMSEEEIKIWAEYARRILHPTSEEKAELEEKCRELEARFERRTSERKRHIIAIQQQARKPKKLKFFGVGWWWYE
jgi:hypothetical protein